MKRLISFLVLAIGCALSGGCDAKDPDLSSATQAFQNQNPEYFIRSSRVVSNGVSRKLVMVEFDAPNNAKNRGRAELLMEKGTNGSWAILSEDVSLWKH